MWNTLPQGLLGWVAAVMSLASLALALLLAYGMLAVPAWDILPGRLGAAGLRYPLNLLIVAVCAAILWLLARRAGAHVGTLPAAVSTIMFTCLALWPTIVQWRMARSMGVPISITADWAGPFRTRVTTAVPARTETFGVAPDGTQLLLDVWPADARAGSDPRPAIVRVHGGGWHEGMRSDMPAWNHWLNALGFHVFDITYRMPPPERWRDEVGDVKCALGWVQANAGRLGVEPMRISLLGNSAGANLAMLAAYTVGAPELPPSCNVAPVQARSVVNIYGPTDLAALATDSATPRVMEVLLQSYIGGTVQAFPERYRLVSPLFHVGAATPPTISFVGVSDRMVAPAQIGALDTALARAGVAHESWFIPAADHAYDVNWNLIATQITRARIALFLKTHG